MKNFYVALTYGDVPPGQKFRFNEYFGEKDVDWGNCQSLHRWSCKHDCLSPWCS